jgi:hypothetical protein
MTQNKFKYFITADSTGFEKGFNKAAGVAKTTGKAIGAGIAVGAVAIAGMTKLMAHAVELAGIQEQAEAKLGAVLKSTGNAAGYNLDQMKKMASAMQGVTTVGDEVIISGMAVLATFKEIKGKGFEDATMAALDMSTVLKTDLNSSLVQIGKALNDPIKGMTALSRSGVSFTQAQKDQVKALQESGDMMGAQAIILKELKSEFGGAAVALRGTFKGSVDAAKNAFGDLEEEIGFSITKNKAFVGLAQEAEETFIDWTKAVADNQEAIASFATGTLHNIESVVNTLGAAFVQVQEWSAALEEVGNKRTILQLRQELGEANEELYRAQNGWFGYGKASEEAIDKAQRGVDALSELINDLETGETALIHAKFTAEELDSIVEKAESSGESVVAVARETADKVEVELSKAAKKEKERYADSVKQTNNKILAMNGIASAASAQTDTFVKLEQIKANAAEESTEEMTDDYKEFYKSIGEDFGDTVTRELRGEFDTIGDAWKSLWTGMVGTAASYLGNIVAQFAATQIGNLVSSFFHEGTWKLEGDEYRAVLQDGEMVVPREQADQIRKNMPNGGFDGLVSASSGYSGTTGSYGLSGVSDLAGSLVTNSIMAMLGLSQSPSRMAADFGINQTLGLVSEQVNMLANINPSAYSKLGSNIFGPAGAMGFGTLGGILGSMFGGVIGDVIGDLANDRSFEGPRDAFEAGLISRQEFSQFKSASQAMGIDGSGTLGGFMDALGSLSQGIQDALGITSAVNSIKSGFSSIGASIGLGGDGGGGGFGGDASGFGGNSDGGGDMGRGGHGGDGDMGMGGEGYAHTGGFMLKADEGRIIAQTGEGMLSRKGMANLDRLNRDSVVGDNNEIKSILLAIAVSSSAAAKSLKRFEYEGIPTSTRAA